MKNASIKIENKIKRLEKGEEVDITRTHLVRRD